MNVMGLDMSSKKTGFSYFEEDKLIDYGYWMCSASDWRKRIVYMADQIKRYVEEHHVDMIYAEDVPPMSENMQTVKVLAALQGMLLSISVTHNIPIKFVPVKTWKQVLGMNLSSSRANVRMKKRVKDDFGVKAVRRLKSWVKHEEKKLSIDYANDTHGIDLKFKALMSKKNEDDIADSINVAWSQIPGAKPYKLEKFEDIMEEFYLKLKEKDERDKMKSR